MMIAHETFDVLAALDAIGTASGEEHYALDGHIAVCEDCRRAYDDYAEAASSFARGLVPVAPPAKIRGAVMDGVEPGFEVEEEEMAERRRLGDARWWLGIAATVFVALWIWREVGMRAAREHIASRDAEIATLTEQNTLLTQRNEKLRNELATVAGAGTRMMSLTGQPIAPSASARVFVDSARHRAFVIFANLPANGEDKSYQLWILRASQPKPQSAGVFDVSPNGTATLSVENLPADDDVKSMAVTLEPKGGAPEPGNANYYVTGKP